MSPPTHIRFRHRAVIEIVPLVGLLSWDERRVREAELRREAESTRREQGLLPDRGLDEAAAAVPTRPRHGPNAGATHPPGDFGYAPGWYGVERGSTVCVRHVVPDGAAGVRLEFTDEFGALVGTGDIEPSDESPGPIAVPTRLEDGPMTARLLDPFRCFFRRPNGVGFWARCLPRRPEEVRFWERVVTDPSDATARSAYADWLHGHDDPHAWVFREPRPFVRAGLAYDWDGAAGVVHCPRFPRPTLWGFAGITGRGQHVPFVLSDGTPVPQFVAYLLGVTRLRAKRRSTKPVAPVPAPAARARVAPERGEAGRQPAEEPSGACRGVPAGDTGEAVSENVADVRSEVGFRLRAWQAEGVRPRKYALLVANYYTRYYPFPGGGFVRLVAESADRPLTDEERASAAREQKQADIPILSYDMCQSLDDLGLALTDPERAAGRLIGWGPGYPLLSEVMECLRPVVWDRTALAWEPPHEAVEWARRIYRENSFDELPILADLLEDADCPDRPLLDHCRHRRPHYRGCAALDRILGGEQTESAPHLRLVGMTAGVGGRVWSFSGPFEVGRALPGLDLDATPGHTVSRRHAVVFPAECGWRVTDRDSTNGTYLNGLQVGTEPVGPVRTGDVLQFGSIALRVVFAAPGDHAHPSDAVPGVSPAGAEVLPAGELG